MPHPGLHGEPARIRDIAHAALAVLKSQPQTDTARLAAIGYCFGGTTALELARSGADLKAAVGFHSGLGTARPQDAANIKAKILVNIGADDPIIPKEQRVAFEQEMTAAKVDWRMNLYGGAGHASPIPTSAALAVPALPITSHPTAGLGGDARPVRRGVRQGLTVETLPFAAQPHRKRSRHASAVSLFITKR